MIEWAARRPAVMWALAAGILVSGAVAFGKLPLSASSNVELPKLTISASMPGAAPELVETYVTSPIEGIVQGVRGVRGTSSLSREGQASVTVTLDPKTDIALARLAILERMETLKHDLPINANPTVTNFVPEAQAQHVLLEVTLAGPYTPGTLAKIVDDIVKPRLTTVAGVAGVSRNGGAETRITVSYQPTVMQQLKIAPEDIAAAITGARQVEALGQLKQGTQALSVTVNDQPRIVTDLARLPVTASGGRTFVLGEIASIRPEEDSRGSFYRLNGRTAVSLSLSREPGADAIETAARARAVLPEIQALLPVGVELRVSSDDSEDVARKLRDLVLRGTIAFVSVFVVLFITLRSLSGGSLVIGSAAVAIAGAALSLYLLRIPANMLTLAGLGMGIGILVQNGLVVVERLRAARNTPEDRAAAGRRIAPAVLGSTLTTTVVLLPFLYLQGNARAQFAPFAGAFALALFWSVGTALLLVPAIGHGEDGRTHGWPRLARLYRAMVGGTVRWRYVTVAFTMIAVGVLTWAFVKKVPRVDWGRGFVTPRVSISANITFPRGSDPAAVERIISELEAEAVGAPGVSLVRSNGAATSGSVTAEFTPEASESDAPWILSDKLTARAVLIAGTDHVYVSKPPGGQGYFNSSGGSGGGSTSIRILGYSYDGVLQLALDLKARLERIGRVYDININGGSNYYGEGGGKAVFVSLTPDRSALGRFGATAADYSRSVGRQIAGANTATDLVLGNEIVRVVLRAAGSQTRDTAQLAEGMVSNPLGRPVRIGDVSRVGEMSGMAQVQRENQQYIRTLTYNFRGPQTLADRTHKAFMRSITVPPGYTVTDEHDYYGGDDSSKGLGGVFAIGIVLVLLAVALVFNSVWAAGMVLLALPMALGGVVAAFWITKTAFNREAAVGVILVVGLAVNHSILLIDAALESRRKNGNRLTMDDVLRAAADRVTMIVLVTLTTLASLIPMALGTKSDSMFGAIALATAGGTVAGTLGVMFLLPPMMVAFRSARRAT